MPPSTRRYLVCAMVLFRNGADIVPLLAAPRRDDGIWFVSFGHHDLGYCDLEQRTLQPLDNPFGPRLSPMS
jgi:hypothetical protein